MILGFLSLFVTFSVSKLLDSIPENSNEADPPTSPTQEFVPGKIVFSTKQKFIITFTASVSAILIIIGIIIAIKFGRKSKRSPRTADIENFMLRPSDSRESIDEVEL
ncbi:hypothetical protein M9Y10_012409 [Tritrichomonas musculus]|uniref:Uncharacterized protein n=1 Tax=Tritrichomonas musculus TaxID=1915356 RepID=A0ABR2ICG7_9EUKA